MKVKSHADEVVVAPSRYDCADIFNLLRIPESIISLRTCRFILNTKPKKRMSKADSKIKKENIKEGK